MIKKIGICALVLGIGLIVTGNSVLVYNLMKDEKINIKELTANVSKDYNALKKDIETFNEVREEYDEKVASNLFLETIEEYDTWIEVIDSYTKTISQIDMDSNNLKKICLSKNYTEEELKNKCDAFIIAYEESVNSYVKDISDFNEQVSSIKEKVNDDKITEYDLPYDYVDINSDGIAKGLE